MGNIRSTAITVFTLSIFMIIVMAVISVISSDTTETEELSEDDLIELFKKAVNEPVEKMTTYLEIPHKIGKYHDFSEIRKIAFEITPLISKEIDMDITVRLLNGNSLKLLEYNGNSANLGSNYLFDHPIWDALTENDFSYIVTHDKDDSMIDNNIINNHDRAYVVINLPQEFYMKKGDTMAVTFIPHPGIERTIIVEAPLPMNQIVEI